MTDEMKARATQLIADLGGNVDEIAASLKRLGIRGVPGDGCLCPIARYLLANGVNAVYIGPLWIEFEEEEIPERVVTPVTACQFITAFDEYPERYDALIGELEADHG